MKYQAVIFDLFGTLVDNPSIKKREVMLGQTARILNVPPADFITLWDKTMTQRDIGVFQKVEDNFRYLSQQTDLRFTKEQLKQVIEIRMDWVKSLLVPRKQAVEVLSSLKSQKYKIGLLSDCSIEVPMLWKSFPLDCLIDTAVFSCSVGMKKPDPRIYHMVTDRLNVEPGECLYVGDGSSRELTGAAQAGLHPALIRIHDLSDSYQAEAEGDGWKGPTISSLKQVLDLIK